MISTADLKINLFAVCNNAKVWFEKRATLYTAEEFHKKGGIKDSGQGCVYVYFGPELCPLYVGHTKRRVKARLHDQTSPHKLKSWFKEMKSISFLQLENDMDRQILEFLLILAYAPKHNVKPRSVNPEEVFITYK